jgi:hypothetical protein
MFVGKILFFLLSGFLLSVNISFANIKYSLGPQCNDEKVVCKGQNELPVCIVLNPKVHIESVELVEGSKVNRYQPLCNGAEDNLSPGCIDLLTASPARARNVVVECFEQVRCVKNSQKLTAFCEGGKMPKCLGSDTEPDCNSKTLCSGKSIPVCDYVWQANAVIGSKKGF